MSFHCFTFQNLHEDVSCVAVGFKLDFFETAEPNEDIFVSVRFKFEFNGLDFKRFFVEFLFHDK